MVEYNRLGLVLLGMSFGALLVMILVPLIWKLILVFVSFAVGYFLVSKYK